MKSAKPTKLSWITLVTIGVLAIIMGLAFVLLRPSIVLLPEDQRYTGLSPEELRVLNAQLFSWMGMVFRSWGAFAIGLGTMISGVAGFAYRQGEIWAERLLIVAGLATFSIFLAVNIKLQSDFKFVIALLLLAYSLALGYGIYRRVLKLK